MEKITSFRGKNYFLSNFYPCKVEYNGYIFPSVEHAFQAAKCDRPTDVKLILNAKTPKVAKLLGKRVKIKIDWEAKKKDILFKLLLEKFKDGNLKAMLLNTNKLKLVEENSWHDKYWGICVCVKCKSTGANVLGELLMRVRNEIQK